MAGWLKGVLGRITGSHQPVDWDEIEAALWQSDLGAPTATAILDSLRTKGLALHAENVLAAAREEVVSSTYGSDPAALCHDALMKAKRLQSDFLICDTAGRLHTKSNLMQELSKVKRSLSKIDPAAPQEIFLVADTTTGSNAVVQAREFHAVTGLTGLILTKLDGSGKGGVAVAIARETGIHPRFVGTGEGVGDLALFDRASFLDRML